MTFQEWVTRWSIPPQAINELIKLSFPDQRTETIGNEADAQQRVRLEAARRGVVFWRNNVGQATGARGGVVRFGLANDSPAVNSRVKSSDLIGIRPVTVTTQMVGLTVGIFTAREMKRSGWKFTGTDREKAQLAYITIVNGLGGDAAFSTGEFI